MEFVRSASSLSQADLDYPCASFPVTFASAEKDIKLASYIPINEIDKRCYEQCMFPTLEKRIDCR